MSKELNSLQKAALAYAKHGFRVFPLEYKGKKPRTKHGVKDATSDFRVTSKWWQDMPDANIGVATGQGLLVLDIDGEEGQASLDALIAEHGELPETPVQVTGKGKHYLFSVDEEIPNTAGRVGKNIDTRGDGGYIVICPSIHPSGRKYSWEVRASKVERAPAPEWLLEAIRKPKKKISEIASENLSKPDMPANADKYIDAAVNGEYEAVANAGNGTRNHTLNQAAFKLGTLVGAKKLDESFVISHLLKASEASGLLQEDGQAACQKTIESGLKAGIAQPRVIPEVQMKPRQQQVAAKSAPKDPSISLATKDGQHVDDKPEFSIYRESVWLDGEQPSDFVLNGDGGIAKSSLHNALLHLRHEKALKELFALDEMSRHVMVTRDAPWGLDTGPRLLCDADITALCVLLENRGLNLKFENAKRIISMVAQENKINPIRERLLSLKWDGEIRLDNWTQNYLGTDETLFNSDAGAKWLISAVARIMKPGCKVDTMLVLEGPQGARKSSALAELAGALDEHCFTDRLSKLDGKDAVIELQGNVIVEIAELDAFKGTQVSTIKAFLSRQVDKVRLPWDATITEIKRACVFAGTVNPGGAGWLSDATGARRFWPMSVTTIDLVGLQEVAPQLWAEALVRYQNGEEWWLTNADVIAEAERAVEERYDEDAWAPLISEYMYGKTEVRVQRVLETIGIARERWDKSSRNRIGAHLRRAGFDNKSKRDKTGGVIKVWVRHHPYGLDDDPAAVPQNDEKDAE